ncbi:MAG TPA: hypothetical protein DEP35_07085 [Deltaproteobacteria bacterium]|nr:hypothetical protein [Deltaproteobacteria bacterium]
MRGRFTRKADKAAHFLSPCCSAFLGEARTTRHCEHSCAVGLIDGAVAPRGDLTLLRLEIGIERLATAHRHAWL